MRPSIDKTPVTLDTFCRKPPEEAAEEIERAQKEAAHARKTYRRRAAIVKDAVRAVLRDYPETRANKDLLVRITNERLPSRHSPDSILRRAREIQNDPKKPQFNPDTATARVRIEEEEMERERARETREENGRDEEEDDESQFRDRASEGEEE